MLAFDTNLDEEVKSAQYLNPDSPVSSNASFIVADNCPAAEEVYASLKKCLE